MGHVRLMRIEVAGKQFVFPRECACCGGFPETTLTISGSERNRNSRTRGWAWDVPYCQECRRHVKAADRVLIVGLTIASAFGFCSLLYAPFIEAWTGSVILGASVIVPTTIAALMLPKLRSGSDCCTVFRALVYLGSAGNVHSFDFRSRDYARGFVRANRLKLVNASASVSGFVRDPPVSENQVARRITKRLR